MAIKKAVKKTRKATSEKKPKPAVKKATKKVVRKTPAKRAAKTAAKTPAKKITKTLVRKTVAKKVSRNKAPTAQQIATQLGEMLKTQIPTPGSMLPLGLVAALFSPASQEVLMAGLNILVGQGVLAFQGESYVFTGQIPAEDKSEEGKATTTTNTQELAKSLAQSLQKQGTPSGALMPSIEALCQMTNGIIAADAMREALDLLTAQGVLKRTPEGTYIVTGAGPH